MKFLRLFIILLLCSCQKDSDLHPIKPILKHDSIVVKNIPDSLLSKISTKKEKKKKIGKRKRLGKIRKSNNIFIKR